MKKLCKILILWLSVIVTTIGLAGCTSLVKSANEFDLEQFEIEMKSKGYEYKRQNLEEGLLASTSQYMHLKDNLMIDGKQVILYDTEIVVYSYENNEEMEANASIVNEDASIISKKLPMEIEWTKTPHFYKKGKIIVQYIGDDEPIIADLNEIMGEQFSGSTTNNWAIYEDLGKNYILLNTNTNEKITEVYDVGEKRFLSAQEAVDALNNKTNPQVDYKYSQ